MTTFSEVAITHIHQNLYAAYSMCNGYDESAYYAMYQIVRRATSAQDMLTRLTRERGEGYEGRRYSSPEYTRIMNTLHETLMVMGGNMLNMEEVLGSDQSVQLKTRTALTMMRLFLRGYVEQQLTTTENSNAAIDTLLQKLDGCVSGTEFVRTVNEYSEDLRRRCGLSRVTNRAGLEQRWRVVQLLLPAIQNVYEEEITKELRQPVLVSCYGVRPADMEEEEWHMSRLGHIAGVRMGVIPRFVKIACPEPDKSLVFDTLMLVDVYEGMTKNAQQYTEKRNAELLH